MLRTIIAGAIAAVTLGLAGAARAQAAYLSDWSLAEMKSMVVASGSKVTSEDNGATPYLLAETPDGMKFSITGNACEGAAGKARCRGAYLQASFTMGSDAEVDAAVKRLAPEYWLAISNDDKALMVSRYLVFDYGVHRENVILNIKLFVEFSGEIWDKI